jgi:hypothetical protein
MQGVEKCTSKIEADNLLDCRRNIDIVERYAVLEHITKLLGFTDILCVYGSSKISFYVQFFTRSEIGRRRK